MSNGELSPARKWGGRFFLAIALISLAGWYYEVLQPWLGQAPSIEIFPPGKLIHFHDLFGRSRYLMQRDYDLLTIPWAVSFLALLAALTIRGSGWWQRKR